MKVQRDSWGEGVGVVHAKERSIQFSVLLPSEKIFLFSPEKWYKQSEFCFSFAMRR